MEIQMSQIPFRVVTLDSRTGDLRPEFSGSGIHMPDGEAQIGNEIVVADVGAKYSSVGHPIIRMRIPSSSLGHIGAGEAGPKEDLLICVID
jgi:hypothetical protein